MRGKKLLCLLLGVALGSSLSVGFAACNTSDVINAMMGGSSPSSETTANNNNSESSTEENSGSNSNGTGGSSAEGNGEGSSNGNSGSGAEGNGESSSNGTGGSSDNGGGDKLQPSEYCGVYYWEKIEYLEFGDVVSSIQPGDEVNGEVFSKDYLKLIVRADGTADACEDGYWSCCTYSNNQTYLVFEIYTATYSDGNMVWTESGEGYSMVFYWKKSSETIPAEFCYGCGQEKATTIVDWYRLCDSCKEIYEKNNISSSSESSSSYDDWSDWDYSSSEYSSSNWDEWDYSSSEYSSSYDDWSYSESSGGDSGDCVFPEEPELLNGVYYLLASNGSYATVVGCDDSVSEIEILSTYQGVPVTSIDGYAFNECSSLTSITVSENNANYKSIDGNLYSKDGTTLIQYAIGKAATEFVIPDGVMSIGEYAFYGCSSLTSIEIPDSVTSIGDDAFYNCSSLEYTIKDGLKYLGNTNNPYVLLMDTETTDITTATIADTCKVIYQYAFGDCNSLTSVAIPDGVTSIGACAFENCSSLTSIEIPDGVTSIGNYAFLNCSSLTSVEIPERVMSIGEYEFFGCSNLTSIEIPDSVTSIGSNAFYHCSSLTSVVIPDSVTSIGYYAFENCSSLTIYCEAESRPNSWNSDWDGYCPVVWDCNDNDVADDGYIYTVVDDVRYGIKDGEATFVRQPSNIQTANIPTSITYKNTIYSVTSIGNYAFSGCSSLTSVVIGDSVTIIGYDAFSGCSSLANISVSENNVNYTSIDGNLYSKDGTTLLQYAIGKAATEFVIPDGVMSIGEYAFRNCSSLTSVVIGDSVTSIGVSAFVWCSSLTEVYYHGAESEWNKISISWDNDNLTSATRYYYGEEEPTEEGNYWHYVNSVITVW